MKQNVLAVVIILLFLTLFSLSVIGLINNGINIFDVLIIVISVLGLTEITYKFIKKKRNRQS